MQPISDLSWMGNILDGQAERFSFRGFRVVAVRIPQSSKNRQKSYRYRLLFFPSDSHTPVLSLNLEFTILGAATLTEQFGTEHFRIAEADEGMSYVAFKEWALKRAEKELET